MNASLTPTQRKRQQLRLELGILRGLVEAQKYAGQAAYQSPPTAHDWACWAGLTALAHLSRKHGYVWMPTAPGRRRQPLNELIPDEYRVVPIPDIGRAVADARREAFDRVFRQPHFWLNRDLYRFAVGGAYLEATGTMPAPRTIRDLAAQLGKKKPVPIPGLGDLSYRAVAATITKHRIGTAERRDIGRGYVLEWWRIGRVIGALEAGRATDATDGTDSEEGKADGLWEELG